MQVELVRAIDAGRVKIGESVPSVAASLILLLGVQCGILQAQIPARAVNLRIIVVDSAARADRIVQRLKNGEDFAALAREISIDPTASNGGSMGTVDPVALRSELHDAVKGMAAGQISDVVRLPSGYAILKVAPGETDALQNISPARILLSAATGAIRYSPNVGGKAKPISLSATFPSQKAGARTCVLYAEFARNLSHR